MSRETRLLVATIVVSALVLVALSRFRFPERPTIVPGPSAPLDRLALRATYDDLSGVVASVAPRISPSLAVLVVTRDRVGEPRTLTDVLNGATASRSPMYVPALRVGETTAIAVVGPTDRLLGIVGDSGGASPQLQAVDAIRRLALVRLPPRAGGRPPNLTLSEPQTPTYVVVVEGTRAGPTFRPVFVGSGDRFLVPRWEGPLVAVSSVALTTPGALVFSLEGQFLGLAIVEGRTLAISPAREVVATADRLSALGSRAPLDVGIAVQPLTTTLGNALGVEQGVVIAHVDPSGPAADLLRSSDVVTAVNGRAVDAEDDFLLRLARQMPGREIVLTIVRDRATQTVALTVPASPSDAELPSLVGLEARTDRDVGTVVSGVTPGTAAAVAGLLVGDVVRRAGGLTDPTPAQLNALFEDRPSGASVVLIVERAGRQRVLAVGDPPAADASR